MILLLASSFLMSNPVDLFPHTVKEIENHTTQAIETFQKDQTLFREKNIVSSLNQSLQTFYWKKITLAFLSLTTSDPLLIDKAKQEVKRFDAAITTFENNSAISDLCIDYAKKALTTPLAPFENYLLVKLLASLQKQPKQLYQTLSKRPMQAWTYLRGDTPEILPTEKISIINWNVCFFDQGLSMFFGGVLPWQDRIARISALLKKQNCDILCLQEVFSQEAGEKLYRELKDTYAHFYTNIGPIQYGFNPETYGVSSGLFVASKIPLNNVSFTPYTASPPNRWYGFFSAQINASIRIITTHLHPGSSKEDLTYRANQLKAIDASIQDKIPTFLCGDLNIERSSEEYKTNLEPYFTNHYTSPEWTCLELRDYWWKANQNASTFYEKYRTPEYLDYFLQSKKSAPLTVHSAPILVNDPKTPATALSDHQALRTSITLN